MRAIIQLLIFGLAVPFSALGQDGSSTNSNTPAASRGGGGSSGGTSRVGGRGGRGGFAGFDRGGFAGYDSEFTRFSGLQLPRLDLDFPGGTPAQLVTAIEKASGRPLNAIIPPEFKETQLPALKMKGVTVPQLFEALQMASQRTEPFVTGTSTNPRGDRVNSISYQNTSYGFRAPLTTDPENPVWYFYVARPGEPTLIEPPAKVCRFYQLAPYLENGYSIDDITTAIQTGWKLLGKTSTPTMNFHKDTGLLIAVGEPDELKLIDSALAALSGPKRTGTNAPAPKSTGRQ